MDDEDEFCCNKHAMSLRAEKAELRRLARHASSLASRGQSTVKAQAQIAENRTKIATTQNIISTHAAELADGPVTV